MSNSVPQTDRCPSQDGQSNLAAAFERGPSIRQQILDQIEPIDTRLDEREFAARVFVTVVLSLWFAIPMILAGIMMHFR